jgi:hypothetical protein
VTRWPPISRPWAFWATRSSTGGGTWPGPDEQIAESIQQALAQRADAEGISIGALVAKLVTEGLERPTRS